jgi:hypothetical protein
MCKYDSVLGIFLQTRVVAVSRIFMYVEGMHVGDVQNHKHNINIHSLQKSILYLE